MSLKESHAHIPIKERQALASRLREFRHTDRHSVVRMGHGYQQGRNLEQYNTDIPQGIKGLLKYIKKINDRPTLLDLGAGRGNASFGLRQLEESQGVRLVGTSLTWTPDLPRNLGEGNFHITSAELLDGIENIDGILAVHSLYYSDPRLSVPRMDSVLNRGGAVLANFGPSDSVDLVSSRDESARALKRELYPEGEPFRRYISGHVVFQNAFSELGYFTDIHDWSEGVTLLAIKPGGSVENPAKGFFLR